MKRELRTNCSKPESYEELLKQYVAVQTAIQMASAEVAAQFSKNDEKL